MKIMVFDVPATTGGALTILNQYHHNAVSDDSNEWVFVISTPTLEETRNVKVLKYPWVKKGWFHRLYFDYFVAPRLVKEHNPDEILSLQNVLVPRVKTRQTVYFHQPLPFIEKRYSLFENPKFWIYQNIISKLMTKSLLKANKIIVQTNWVKDACIKKGVSEKRITIEPPVIEDEIKQYYTGNPGGHCLFIYPASALSYKNHELIVKSAILLKKKNIENYKIFFTLRGDENKLSKQLYETIKDNGLNIEFIGHLTKDELYQYYQKAILLFPSYVETFGLPMLEAKMHKTPVIASDCTFSHEILDGYEKVGFFKYHDEVELSEMMSEYL